MRHLKAFAILLALGTMSLSASGLTGLSLTPDIRPAQVDITPAHDIDLSEATTLHAPQITPWAKDYSLSITIPSCGDDNVLPLSISVGKDIAKVKYLCYEGDYKHSDSNLRFVAENGDEIDSDDYASMQLTLTTERNSRFTLFVVGLDSSDGYQSGVATYFYSVHDDDDMWADAGTATYTDDMLASIFAAIYTSTYKVKIQEHKSIQGYLRLVNPYGVTFPYSSQNRYNTHSHNHYIYIHAEDPEAVYIEESPICFDKGYGGISVASLAIPDWTGESTAPYVGTLDSNTKTITFPAKSLVVAMQNYNDGTWYRANSTGRCAIVLPYLPIDSGVEQVEQDEPSQPSWYTLQGVKVAVPTPGTLYIRVEGSKAAKVMY